MQANIPERRTETGRRAGAVKHIGPPNESKAKAVERMATPKKGHIIKEELTSNLH